MPTQSKSFMLPLSLEKVSEILSNLELFGGYHPLIKSCELAKGSSNQYQVIEQPFLWLPFKISYNAIVMNRDNEITYELSGIPLHKAAMTFILSKKDSKMTFVDLTINVQGPLLIANYLMTKVVDAQNKTFVNITSS